MNRVKSLIKKLGDKCQKIIQYYYYDKMGMKEISEKLGYTNSANAKNQKYKCMKQLKGMMLNG